MSSKKSIILWIIAVLLTICIAFYQKMTGPTYPISGSIDILDENISYSLPRIHGGDGGKKINIEIKNTNIKCFIKYKRFKSYDEWVTIQFKKVGNLLEFTIPHQPPAGKVIYSVFLRDNKNNEYFMTGEPVVIRFRGHVPLYFLIPHIIFIFLAMCFSTRTGFEAILKGKKTYKYIISTIILLILGGFIFGPIVQKYAFGAFWTGWPFGHDLTDNKTVVALLFWIFAVFRLKKYPEQRWPVFLAAIMLIIVFLIPHSLLGSEIDYTKNV